MLSMHSCNTSKPEDEFSPALTAAAATMQSGVISTPVLSASTPTHIPVQTTIMPTGPCSAAANVNSINIRRTPSGDIIGCCLAKGEKVEIREIDGNGQWALISGIDCPSHQGWVKLRLLKTTGECSLLSATPQN